MNHNTPSRKPSLISTPLASSTVTRSTSQLSLNFSSSNSSRKNFNTKLDYTFNEYLQALAKKRIVSSSIKNYEDLLKQQIHFQNQAITKMKEECVRKKILLNNSDDKNQLVKLLQELEKNFQYCVNSRESTTIDQLITLSDILETAFVDLKLVNVKSLSNIEEWICLMELMNEDSKFLQDFFKSHKDIKEFGMIDEITLRFKEALELQMNITEQIETFSLINKNICVKYLEIMKELFEVLGKQAI